MKDKDIDVKKENKTSKSNKKKISKKQRVIYNCLMGLFAMIFVVSAVYLIRYFVGVYKNEKKTEEIKDLIITEEAIIEVINDDNLESAITLEVEPQYVEIDGITIQKKFEEVYKKNSDFVGWLTVGDTVIDYPVMQHPGDNEYYLRRDVEGSYNESGTLFADLESDIKKPSDNIIIYGHNMKSGKMFHTLLEYYEEDYYNKYKYIRFDTIYEDGVYEIIGAFYTQIYPEDYTGFKYYNFFDATSEEEFNNYIANCKALTPYETSNASYGDKLLTLSTCAYHTDNGRFVVVAKKVKK